MDQQKPVPVNPEMVAHQQQQQHDALLMQDASVFNPQFLSSLGNPLRDKGGRPILMTNFAPEGREQTMQLLSIKDSPAIRGDTVIDKTLAVTGYIVHPFYKEMDGEMTPLLRTVLVLHDGTLIDFKGTGILRSLSELASVMPEGTYEWSPPLALRVVVATTANGYKVHKLVPVKQEVKKK